MSYFRCLPSIVSHSICSPVQLDCSSMDSSETAAHHQSQCTCQELQRWHDWTLAANQVNNAVGNFLDFANTTHSSCGRMHIRNHVKLSPPTRNKCACAINAVGDQVRYLADCVLIRLYVQLYSYNYSIYYSSQYKFNDLYYYS